MAIFGLDSAVREAKEKQGNNMLISANLVLEVSQRISELERNLMEYAECIDALVDNGSITSHPQVEMDALTDGMRTVARK